MRSITPRPYAVRVSVRARARRLALFHRKPSRTDAELDEVARRFAAADIPVTVAAEDLTIELWLLGWPSARYAIRVIWRVHATVTVVSRAASLDCSETD
jgi:hypothetical protein